jgi:hypothetical protein
MTKGYYLATTLENILGGRGGQGGPCPLLPPAPQPLAPPPPAEVIERLGGRP